MSRRTLILALVLFALAVAAVLATSAGAATYTVGTTEDTAAGTCPNPVSGTCSLRQLIQFEDALAATPNPPDTIVVPSGEYSLAKGELLVTQSLAIEGAGARKTRVVEPRGAEERVFKIEVPKGNVPAVVISGLEISGGTATSKNGFFGGDVYNAGELVLTEDWITEGTASSGGGISNDTGTLAVRRSLVSFNHASTGGGDSGGIQNHGSAICGAACVPGKKATLTVEDSTIADNDARLGAGIFSWSDANDGNEMSVTRSTIAHNSTRAETGGAARGLGGGLLISDGKAEVAGSILAFNSATINETFFQSNCATSRPGTIVSLGFNLETETDCGFESTGDLQGTFSRFGFASSEPQNNGGNTDTLAPEPTSPGVDAIPTKQSLCGGVDQRGIARPQGVACDMGAVEVVPLTIQATAGASFSGVVALPPSCGVFSEPAPTIAWGDGKSSAGTSTEEGITGSHTYAKTGSYNGSVTYNNDCSPGTHKVAFRAQVVGPPVLSEVKAGAVTETTGKVEFTLDPAGSETTYEVEYGLDTKYGSKTTATKLAGGAGPTHEVVTISGLKPNNTYHFRVVASNAQAPGGVRSNDATFATVGPPVLSGVKAGAVTETTGKVEFTVDPAGSETTYEVEYGLDTKYGSKTTAVKLAGDAGPTPEVVTISGLKPHSTYHFRVVASNAQAPGGVRSGDLTFATVGPPVLSEVKAGAVTETTGKVEFTVDPAGAETTYEVEYGLDTKYGSKSAAAKLAAAAGPTHEVVTISGLKANSTYHFRVLAINAQAPGGVRSSDATFATVGPPVVSEVGVVVVTETTVEVAFTVDPAGEETTYEVEYGPNTNYGQKTSPGKLVGGAGPTREIVTISGLNPGSTYHFAIVASNAQASGGIKGSDQPVTTVATAGGGGSGGNLLGLTGAGSGVLGTQTTGPATLDTLPPPVLGKNFNVEPVSGKVLISLPPVGFVGPRGLHGAASESLSKGLHFVPLTEARQIPVGSTLDTTAGVARIETATLGKPQLGDFGAGLFKLLQQRKQRGLTELNIVNNLSPKKVCATIGKKAAVAAKLSSKVLGRLHGSAHGRFVTKGQYSAATVRGTIWSVSNQCNGTLTKVTRDVVTVRDFRRRKTITLLSGQSYLARAPG